MPILGLGGRKPRDRIPDQEDLGAGSPTNPEKDSLSVKDFRTSLRISLRMTYWKIKRFSVFERINLLGFWF